MRVLRRDAEASVRQDLVDLAFHVHELFLRQTISLRTNNRPRTGVSRRGAMQHEREKGPAKRQSNSVANDVRLALYSAMSKNCKLLTIAPPVVI